jgi:subtilisin-like proprotein convertase family protein
MNFQSLLGNVRRKMFSQPIARRKKQARLRVESLEDRAVPAVLPTPFIDETDKTIITSGRSPKTALDPTDSDRLVSVSTTGNVAKLSYSTDGGATWNTLTIASATNPNAPNGSVSIDPTSPAPGAGNPFSYARITAPSVAFDKFHNVFVTYAATNPTHATSGEIVVRKYDFSGGVPNEIDLNTGGPVFGVYEGKVITRWVGAGVGEAVGYSPFIAVDTSEATFQDPDVSGAAGAQVNNHVAQQTSEDTTNVYVVWATDNRVRNTPAPTNSNDIAMSISGDGGLNWSTRQYVNDSFHGVGSTRSRPQIVFTQGRAGDSASGGQMVVTWSTGTGITTDALPATATDVTVVQNGQTGPIADRPSGDPAPPATTTFNNIITDSEVPSDFAQVDDLDLTIAITHADLRDLRVVLQSPDGTRSVTLFLNGYDLSGNDTGLGIQGNALGVNNFDTNLNTGWVLGTTFNDHSPRSIFGQGAAAPFIGHFRPTPGSSMSVFNGMSRNEVIGTWRLLITDVRNTGVGQLRMFQLRISSNVNTTQFGSDSSTGVLTAASTLDPDASPLAGYSVAVDNTLGAFSPYQNRIYIAFSSPFRGGDVELTYGDFYDPPGFAPYDLYWGTDAQSSWTINDDFAGDGFSEGNRRQFTPSIAVDRTTGTLALMYYDNRYDPANARAVTMFTTMITGPEYGMESPPTENFEFARSLVLNHMEQAFDQSTTRTLDLEPVPTNIAGAGGAAFSLDSGITVHSGRVNAIWAGNLNTNGVELRTQLLNIAAGPRVFRGDMGPIFADGIEPLSGVTYNNTFDVGGDGRRRFDGFVVEFDRPIDPSTFTIADVEVLYRSPTDNPIGPGLNVPVTGIQELNPNQFGTSRFLVSVAPQTKTGTYSYTIGPDISDRIRLGIGGFANVVPNGPAQQFNASAPEVPQPILDLTTITSTINVPAGTFGPTDVVADVNVTLDIDHTFNSDLTITLIAPNGNRITLTSGNGGSADGFGVTFDDSAAQSITGAPTFGGKIFGNWRPEELLAVLNGSVLEGDWILEVSDDVGADEGFLLSWSVNLTPGDLVSSGSIITQYGNQMDQDADGTENETVDDKFAVPKPVNGVPFILPYTNDTLPLSLPGTHIVRTRAQNEVTTPDLTDHIVKDKSSKYIDIEFDRKVSTATFKADDIIHIIGPRGPITGTTADPIRVVPINVLGGSENTSLTTSRFFRIHFPTQTLNGTYQVQIGVNILDSDLNRLDSDLDAGVENLTGKTSSGITSTVSPSTGDTSITLLAGKTTNIPLTVTDAFLLEKVTVTMSLLHPDVRNLEARLIAPDGTSVLLFKNNIGFNGATTANMTNTTFDDAAANPIQTGTAPFLNASFNPMQPLAPLIGHTAAGTWKLAITNNDLTNNGSLTLFKLALSKRSPGSGVGEVTADQASASFRIFNTDPTGSQSRNTWAPVGPTETLTHDVEGNIIDRTTSGRVGAIAVDPSDVSGNTVFVAGASGGIWKTTNFLTRDPIGPTWIQLTDFGPTTAINIGALAVYNETSDASKSVIIAGTGEQSSMNLADPYNYPTTGVGFIVSTDGGKSWRVQDSTINNADGIDSDNLPGDGAPLPFSDAARNHQFVGGVVHKLVFDPVRDPLTQKPAIYAAVGRGSGPAGAAGPAGLWRSSDFGGTWQRVATGATGPGANGGPIDDYTDVVLSNSSGDPITNQPTIIFAAVPGQGVFRTVNRGGSWTLMTGLVGNQLIRDADTGFATAVPVNAPTDNPNGAKGRIVLATPELVKNEFSNRYFGGWIYAAVSTATGDFDGLYVTKDFGDNWTKVRLSSTNYTTITGDDGFGFATNNELGNNVPDGSGGVVFVPNVDIELTDGDGNQGLAIAVDPLDPNIVYVGGDTMIRVDITKLADPRNMTVYSHSNMFAVGVGPIRPNTTGAAQIQVRETDPQPPFYYDPGLEGGDSIGRPRTVGSTPFFNSDLEGSKAEFPNRRVWNYLNLFRDPDQPFPGATDSTLFADNLLAFTNTGNDASWNYVHTHRHGADSTVGLAEDWGDLVTINRMISIIDPISGRPRIIFGDDEGVHTFVTESDSAQANGTGLNKPDKIRGIPQPPSFPGLVSGAIPGRLFNGVGFNAPIDGARNGNLQIGQFRSGAVQPSLLAADIAKALFYGAAHYDPDPGRSSSTVLNDGSLFYEADSRGTPATWVETDGTGSGIVYQLRTTALTDIPTDFFQVTLPGQAPVGRTFGLFEAGDNPQQNQGQWRYGLTKFAVNPIDRNGIAMGSLAGNVFLTTGQGISGVGQWFKIGTPAQMGGDATYAEALAFGAPQTAGGGALNNFLYAGKRSGRVFVTFNAGGTWTEISNGLDGSPIQKIVADPGRGSRELYAVTEQGVYHMADSGAASPVWTNITSNLGLITHRAFGNPDWNLPMAQILHSLAVDWRFKYDKNPRAPRLYVGGDAGVFRSTDGGNSWARYPDDGISGGFPMARVVDLDLSTGNIQQATGLPNPTGSPDMLVATTMGRGLWSIRLDSPTISGPMVIANSLNQPMSAPGASVSQFEITFDVAINPETFTEDDIVRIVTPGGTITDRATINAMVDVLDITFPPPGQANKHDKWRISFATPFTADGTYQVVIGPDINDWAGRPMDQNGNSVNGQVPGDQYVATFVIGNNDLLDFVKDTYGKLLTPPGGPTRLPTTDEILGKAVQNIQTARFKGISVVLKELLATYSNSEARNQLVRRLFSNGNVLDEIGHLLPGYEALIGTPAFNTEVANLVAALKNGKKSPESIVGDILLKPEYFAAAGGTPLAFVQRVYQDLFKGTGIQFEWLPQSTQTAQVTQASSVNGRNKLVRSLVGNLAVKYYQGGDTSTPLQTIYFRGHEVALAYQKYLGRPATAAEISAGRSLINKPLAKNNLQGSEWLLWKVLGSQEYFGLKTQTETNPTLPDNGLHTNRSWVDGVIADRYFRTADTDADGLLSTRLERDEFSQKVLDRYKKQRTQFLKGAKGIVGVVKSTEFRTAEIKRIFQMVHGPTRVVSDNELQSALSALANGTSFQTIIAGQFGTQEFFDAAPDLVGEFVTSNNTWARAVYFRLFGTDPGANDAKVIALANKAGSTTTSRTSAAKLVLVGTATTNPNGTQYRDKQITDAFQLLLGRAPTTVGQGNERDKYQAFLKKNRWEFMLAELIILREFWEIKN